MITAKALREWLATVPENAEIGIDEGGLQLQVVTAHLWGPYLEVGGMPDEVCEECEAAIFYKDPETPAANDQHAESCSLYRKAGDK